MNNEKHYLKLSDLDLKNKRVLIREDFNVPVKVGVIQDDTPVLAVVSRVLIELPAGVLAVLAGEHLCDGCDDGLERHLVAVQLVEFIRPLFDAHVSPPLFPY